MTHETTNNYLSSMGSQLWDQWDDTDKVARIAALSQLNRNLHQMIRQMKGIGTYRIAKAIRHNHHAIADIKADYSRSKGYGDYLR